jgi:hypothetical protein
VRALILKDLRVLKPWWWLIVPGHVLFASNGIVASQGFFAMNAALAWALMLILLIVEWTQEADRYVLSLPVSRRLVVEARYAEVLGVAVGGTILYAVYGRVLLALATERLLRRWPDAPGWESAEGLLGFFLVVWLVSVVYLPFAFGWGLGRGTWLFLVSILPLVAVGAILLRGETLPRMPVSGLLVSPSGALAALAGAGGLGWLSLRLSARLYDRRDL